MTLETRDILQINATVITGILILLSIASSPTKIFENIVITIPYKYIAGTIISFFASSAGIEILPYMRQALRGKEHADVYYVRKYSISFMLIGFVGLAIFGSIIALTK